jgi:tetratricopeptide (TPR) repeat protein
MSTFIAELKSQFAQAEWSLVVSALRNQPILWNQLITGDFGKKALEASEGIPAKMSPGFLALLSLSQEHNFEALRKDPMQPVAESLRLKANSTYENLVDNNDQSYASTPDIQQALSLALALRERYRLAGSWENLLDDLAIAELGFWQLSLACLYSLLPNPAELLSELIKEKRTDGHKDLAFNALYSNPLSIAEQFVHVQEASKMFSDAHRLALLRLISQRQPKLAALLAKDLLEKIPETNDNNDGVNQLAALLQQSEIHQLSGQHEAALPLLTAAWEASRQVQANLASKLAESASKNDDRVTAIAALEQAALLNPDDAVTKDELLSKQLETGQMNPGFMESNDNQHPNALIAAARIAHKNGDLAEAQSMAQSALEITMRKNVVTEAKDLKIVYDLAQVFLDIQLPAVAKKTIHLAIERNPQNAETEYLLGVIEANIGNSAAALDSAHLAVALNPDDPRYRSFLAKTLTSAGIHEEAYIEWKALHEGNLEMSSSDHLLFAECAYRSEHFNQAALISAEIVEREPGNASAQLLLGKSLVALDNPEAIKSLQQATQLNPQLAEAWLGLAEYHLSVSSSDEAEQTLKAASNTIVDSAEIHAALGQLYLGQSKYDEALDAFREANRLFTVQVNQSELAQTIALELGNLEIQLEYSTEGRSTLEQAHMAFPSNAKLAHAFGALLLSLESPSQALKALTSARQADPKNIKLQLDTARAHLNSETQLERGLALLNEILLQDSKNLDAKLLLAQTQLALGQTDIASKNFDTLLKTQKGLDSHAKKQVKLGIASTLAKAGNINDSISRLEDLQKSHPQDLEVLRALCDAYCNSERQEEAFQIAQQLYLSSDQSTQTILWYVDIAEQADKVSEAKLALSKAIDTSKEANPLIFRLAELQWQSGNKSSARESFTKLAKTTASNPNYLIKISNFLRDKGEIRQSISYLQKAIDESASEDAGLFDLLSELLLESKQHPKALQAIEKAIELAPNNPNYLVIKSEILQLLGKPQAALESLAKALELLPEDPNLLLNMAKLLVANKDWSNALNYAEKAAVQNQGDPALLLFASHLAANSLQFARARTILSRDIRDEKNAEIAYLMADMALEEDESVKAAQAIVNLDESKASNPHHLALLTRLAVSSKDFSKAEKLLTKTLKAYGSMSAKEKAGTTHQSMPLAVALAAKATNKWDTAIKLFKQAAAKSPDNARVQFALAKALIERAEWQLLCQASQTLRHAPGEVSLSKASYRAALKALKLAQRATPFADTQSLLSRWQTRAELRFEPKAAFENLPVDFPSNAFEAAALVTAGHEMGLDDKYEKRVEPFAKTPEVLIALALAYTANDASLAAQWAKKAIQLNRHQTAYYMIHAQIAWAANDVKGAMKSAQKALALWPNEARWQAIYAAWLQAQGEHQLAIEHLEQSAQLEPNQATTQFNLGKELLETGALDRAIISLDRANQLDSENSEYLLTLAQAKQRIGDIRGARQNAKQANKINPSNSEGLITLAELALESNQTSKATNYAEKAIELKPNNSQALCVLAESKLAEGKSNEAIQLLEQAQQIAEDSIPVQIRRAQILPKSRGEGSDIKALARLSERFPKRADIALALSDALALTGNLEEATQIAQQAIKQAEQLPALEQARLHYHLGQLLKHNGQLDQALHHLDKAAKVANHLSEIHIERGQVFLARRQHDQALNAFEAASKAAPNDAQPHLQAAMAHKEAKDYVAAEKGLRLAADLAPKDRFIQRQLAALMALNFVHPSETLGNAS